MNDGRVVPNFIRQALAGEPLTVYMDGSQTRAFQYFSDLVEGVYRLLLSDEHLPVNIGNPNEMTILEFARAVVDISGSDSEIHFVQPEDERTRDDPKQRRPDIRKAKRCSIGNLLWTCPRDCCGPLTFSAAKTDPGRMSRSGLFTLLRFTIILDGQLGCYG